MAKKLRSTAFFKIDISLAPSHSLTVNPDISSKFLTHQEELDFLSKNNFPINPYNSIQSSLEDIWETATKLEKNRNNLFYPIDGLVVKLNDNHILESVGVVGKTPRAWCAIKFSPEEVSTQIESITWQVGRTGKVTPVANLSPVNLMGSIVKRASLHNFKEVQESELHFQDTVIIRKAGDIIPEVVKIMPNLRHLEAKIIPIPENCPSCTLELQKSKTDVDLYCSNVYNCPDQVVARLSYFCQRNMGNIVGLSEKNILKFMQEFNIKDVPDLYKLPWDKIQNMEGYGLKSVENLQKSVENSKTIADYKFLAGLGLEGVGVEVSKLIVEQIYDQQN